MWQMGNHKRSFLAGRPLGSKQKVQGVQPGQMPEVLALAAGASSRSRPAVDATAAPAARKRCSLLWPNQAMAERKAQQLRSVEGKPGISWITRRWKQTLQ
jgi:hypothetical protein